MGTWLDLDIQQTAPLISLSRSQSSARGSNPLFSVKKY